MQVALQPGTEQLKSVVSEALDTCAKKGGTDPHSAVLPASSVRGLHCWHCALRQGGSVPTRFRLSFRPSVRPRARRLVSDAGRVPASWLLPRLRMTAAVRLPSPGGMVPVSWLLFRLITVSLLRLPSSGGSGPVSWLLLSRRYSSDDRLPRLGGRVPDIWLLFRLKSVRAPRAPSPGGSVPDSCVPLMASSVSRRRLVTSGGRVPPRPLLLPATYSACSADSCPRLDGSVPDRPVLWNTSMETEPPAPHCTPVNVQ